MSQQQPMTNGETPHSQTLNHFKSYPLVSDSVSIYQSNPLGAKSIELFNTLYSQLATPFLPYLRTPYTYAKPYLERADDLGDSSLSSVDTHFPSVRTTDLASLQQLAVDTALFPFRLAGQGKGYVLETYSDEYNKIGGDVSIFHAGKAVVSTELRIVSDAMHAVADYLGPKKDEAVKKAEELKKAGEDKANGISKDVEQRKDQAVKTASAKKEQAKASAQK